MEMVIHGVSTRKVRAVTAQLGVDVSRSTVSRLCATLDPILDAWAHRPLGADRYPALIVDALYVKVREAGHVRSRAVLIVSGIAAGTGQRRLLGFEVGDSESTATWRQCFQALKTRGLHGVDLVVSDSHLGLVDALDREFQGAT